jgi:hypothetical protein
MISHEYKTFLDGNIEVVNDAKMFVAYSPAKILSNTWTVLLMEPYSQMQ